MNENSENIKTKNKFLRMAPIKPLQISRQKLAITHIYGYFYPDFGCIFQSKLEAREARKARLPEVPVRSSEDQSESKTVVIKIT